VIVGRFARDALGEGAGEVCAVFRRSCYLRSPAGRYACVGDASLGRGPLNVLMEHLELPAVGTRMQLPVEGATVWQPSLPVNIDLDAIVEASRVHIPAEGLGCLVIGSGNALSVHAQPALEALERWLRGNALDAEAQALIGLGPGLTPSGDDYLGGMLVALHALGREPQARALWRWLQPRLSRTSPISAAHLEAASAGEAHETLHDALADPSLVSHLRKLGHCSGWDGLAGAVAVLRAS
jgi:hypothetical protein